MTAARGAALAVAIASVLAYARTLSYEFVWDDVLLVARSQRLREIGRAHV